MIRVVTLAKVDPAGRKLLYSVVVGGGRPSAITVDDLKRLAGTWRRETGRIVRIVGAAAILVCTAVVLLYGLLRSEYPGLEG